ncbi:MAG: hypothetical protein Q8O32_02185 [bacterium]|nr:hypothetical protein [bacterium]
MKTKFKIIISISVVIILGLIIYFVFLASQNKKSDFISRELERLSIKADNYGEKSFDFLDNYDPIILSQLCSDAGYDYQPYLGKKMDFVSYKTDSFYVFGEDKHPLKIGIFSYENKIVCVYFLADLEKDANPLSPAVFPVNHPSITKN